MRIALYSHDAVGLGHLRRNLAIAGALTQAGASALLITGVREAGMFPAPTGADYLTVPGYAKVPAGQYEPRFLRTSTQRLAAMRAGAIAAAIEAYEPDLLIVDKHPLGLHGELRPTLELLRARGVPCVLGLRDVLDAPATVRAEWAAGGVQEAVHRHYARLWIYGDPDVYDVLAHCRLGRAMRDRARFTGYLASAPAPIDAAPIAGAALSLCLVGGGEDGYRLANAFARAEMPDGTRGAILTGPMMPTEDRRNLERLAGDRMDVLGFVPDPSSLMHQARSVVTMGGYNTVCELLARGARTLIVPRVAPRQEQLIRAQVLQRRGLVDVLHPTLATAARLSGWLASPPAVRGPRATVRLDGLLRLPGLLDEVLAARPSTFPIVEAAHAA